MWQGCEVLELHSQLWFGYNNPMTISRNYGIIEQIKAVLDKKTPVSLGVNKSNEIIRLVYEISRQRNVSPEDVLAEAGIEKIAEGEKGGFFARLKGSLVAARYPSLRTGRELRLVPVKIKPDIEECKNWDFNLAPRSIFIEKEVERTEWTKKFIAQFPDAEIKIIEKLDTCVTEQFLKKDRVRVYNSRLENIFIVKSKTSFIKICPCTKACLRCGYWILNLGFGCPMDCAYCYLQGYSNIPGIILPANITDYERHIAELDRKTRKKLRIGTGEFTDSLAFDKYTGYSGDLIGYFKNKRNLVLELKTKMGDIEGILKEKPHDNVVISWSTNTRFIAERYENGGSDISGRIGAARQAVEKGYSVGFHFDPIVYYDNWEDDYRGIVEELFGSSDINKKTVWISLGTLRHAPALKQIAEQRFSDNRIFYGGEFFEGFDGKMRYPQEIRVRMYNKMIEWIRKFNSFSWIYLCMEPEEVWKSVSLGRRTWSGD